MRLFPTIRTFVIGGAALGGLTLGLGALPGVAHAAGGEPGPTTIIVVPGPATVTAPGELPAAVSATPAPPEPGCGGTETTGETSPELQAASKKVDRLRESGGWAFKAGNLQRAENKVGKLCGERAPSVY